MNEKAVAPELKKGVKMTLHHSRDSAQKQWSETTALSFRGLLKVFKICSKKLFIETWFFNCWKQTLSLCQQTIIDTECDTEVRLVGVDGVFGMLLGISDTATEKDTTSKISASSDYNAHTDKFIETMELRKQELWRVTFTTILDVSAQGYSVNGELALKISQYISKVYKQYKAREFRYKENIQLLLAILMNLILTVLPSTVDLENMLLAIKNTSNKADPQLKRSTLETLQELKDDDYETRKLLLTSLADISFINHPILIFRETEHFWLCPAPISARKECLLLLIDIIQNNIQRIPASRLSESPQSRSAMSTFSALMTVINRYVADILRFPIESRFLISCMEEDLSDSLVTMISKYYSPLPAFGIPTSNNNNALLNKRSLFDKYHLNKTSKFCNKWCIFNNFATPGAFVCMDILEKGLELVVGNQSDQSDYWEVVRLFALCTFSPWKKFEIDNVSFIFQEDYCDERIDFITISNYFDRSFKFFESVMKSAR